MNATAGVGPVLWNRRWRSVWISILAVVALWIIALIGYSIAKNARITAEKVRQYIETVDLSKLSGTPRAQAIRKLADLLNALSIDERQRARVERLPWKWLNQMTEEEKAGFIDATMPTGFKQMLTSFEQLPEDKRRKTIDDSLRRLREAQTREQSDSGDDPATGTNGPPILSPELQSQLYTIGLKTFYSQSSAQTKAELAPVLEEIQRAMENGRPFRER